MSIGIVDYGLGNLGSLHNAFDALNIPCSILKTPEEILKADKILLPGVGAFAPGMQTLRSSGMVDSLNEFVQKGNYLLGICLGMQLVCSSSEEDGYHEGLGWIEANAVSFPGNSGLKVPHIGWNNLEIVQEDEVLKNLPNGEDVYFVHSYHVKCADENNILAVSDYGGPFSAIIRKDNVVSMQFHPEKSQAVGLQLLTNFHNL